MTNLTKNPNLAAEIEEQIINSAERKKAMQFVKYVKPEEENPKVLVRLAQSDIMFCAVQILREGGENNLHSHSAMDGLWFVLDGRVRFYGEGNKVLGEFGKFEGVFIPRGVPYWFESCGSEPLQILQAEAIDRRIKNTRTDYEPPKESLYKLKVIKQN